MLMFENKTNPIFITGVPRSGTSLIAGIINICGAYGGELIGACSANKKGMFENRQIRETICKPFLSSIGADVKGQNPLPDREKMREFKYGFILNWRKRVLSAIGVDESQAWFYKGAKMCLMWPVWHLAFPEARWIIVRRDSEKIIDSCLRTSFMNAYKTREEWQKWIDVHLERFEEMKKENLNIAEVSSDNIVNGKFENLKLFIQGAGLTWNESKIKEFISKDLWHG